MNRILKRIMYVAIIPLFFFKLGCVKIPSDLVVPEWDTNFNLPIVNKTYTLNDIIRSQDYITTQATANGDSLYLIQSENYSISSNVGSFVQVTNPAYVRNIYINAGNTNADTIYIPFPEGAQLDSASFISGKFALHVSNSTSANVTLNLMCPGLYGSNGSRFNVRRYISSNQQDTAAYNLAGYNYKVPANQINNKGSLQVILNTTSNLLVSYISLDLYLSDFHFRSVSGIIPPKSLGTKTESFNLNLGDAANFRNKVFLQNGKLNLNVDYLSKYSKPFGIEVQDLNIIGIGENGTQFYLKDSTGSSNFNFKFVGSYQLLFTQKNSNINDFISFLPSKVILTAGYEMNPDDKEGSASIDDSVKFSTHFSTTSYLSLKTSTIIDSTKFSGFSKDDRENIRKAKFVNLSVSADNGIPLTSYLQITLADSLHRRLFTVTNNSNGSDSMYIPGADVDQSGNVSSRTPSTIIVQLDSTETLKFSEAYYAIIKVSVRTKSAYLNPPPVVKIKSTDNLVLHVNGQIKYRVNLN